MTVAPDKTGALIDQLQTMEHVVGLALQRGASLSPPGDVVTIQTTNGGARPVFALLARLEVTQGGSITTSEPRCLIAPPHQRDLDGEANETVWEEMASLLRQDTNLQPNFVMLMALAGAMAATGLWTDTIHVIIAAMLIASGFEPLLRLSLGLIGGPRELATRGLMAAGAGYLSLALGAGATLWILRVIDPATSADLHGRHWVHYFASVNASGTLLAIVGGLAGAIIISSQRSTLTAGVMVALALIPSVSLVGMGALTGDWGLAGKAFQVWFVNVVSVLAASGLVFGLKQMLVHRGTALD